MATSRYEPEVHRACTKEEIQAVSDSLNLHCSPAMVEALTENAVGTLKTLRVLDELPDFVPEVKYPRTPGYKPDPKDNFGKAWAWRCDVSGAPSGKLSGKTFAIKDNCAVAGVPMSNGSLLLEGYTPEYDATVITRILDAGGRILGKAACDDFCLSAMGFSSPDGFIHFKDDKKKDLSVGGSSGGSGVLVASGEVDMAIAGDQGGSIRIPATYTGTVGMKATHGLVPYTGLISIEPILDHVGPIAKTVTDCALFLEVIAGNDGLDARQLGSGVIPEYSKLLNVDVGGRTIGFLDEGFANCVSGDRLLEVFGSFVQKAGLKSTRVSVPLHKDGLAILIGVCCQGAMANLVEDGTCSRSMKGFFSTSLEKAVRQGMQSCGRLLAPGAQSFFVSGELIRRRYGNHYYNKSRNLITVLTKKYDEALEKCDVLVMPTLTRTTKEFLEVKEGTSTAQAHRDYVNQSTDMIGNTSPFNLSGHPALTLPLGTLGDGTVSAMMIVGKKFDELTVFQIARALEKIIPDRQNLL